MLIAALTALVVLASGSTLGRPPAFAAADGLILQATASEQAADKDKQKAPKAKKAKKKNSDAVAPDEEVDPDQPPPGNEGGGHFVWKQHPSIRYGSVFRMDFQAKLQEDAHGAYPDAKGLACPNTVLPSNCTFQLHRNRVGIEGYIFSKKIEYEAERELTEQELTDKDILAGYTPKSQWKDVDVNVSYIKNAQVQVGKFKIPFSLDELTGDSHNDFTYRSLGANYLAPGREIGGQLHGRFFKKGLGYSAGIFEHDGDNAKSKKIAGGDQTVAGRLTGTPLRRMNSALFGSLELGTAFAYSRLSNDGNNPNGLRARTLLTQDTFYDAVYVSGHRRRWEGDMDWTLGSGSVRAEYIWQTDDRLQQGLGDQDLPDARGRSWFLSGTWIVTGEPKTRPVKAANEFLHGGLGAVELAFRVERMWFDSVGSSSSVEESRNPRAVSIFPTGDKAVTFGVNWTLNRWVKLQFNAIREQLDDVERNPIASGGPIWSKILRFQIVL